MFRAFGCHADIYLNEGRENGNHISEAVEVINLGFATICGFKLYILSTRKVLISN